MRLILSKIPRDVGEAFAASGSSPPWPSRDPSVPQPGLRYYQGQWRSEEAIALEGATRTDKDRRVMDGIYYIGMAPRAEQAAELNAMAKAHLEALPSFSYWLEGQEEVAS
jgi:hypothetical protein